jgi:tripartite-type tricarboxylate transporter receptor subunit TctC
MPMTPDVPIFAEVAPEAVGQTWFGLAAPARTPAAAVERLSAAASRALQEPALRDRLLSEGQFAIGSSPGEYAAFLGREMDRWRPLLQRMNIKVD